MVQSDDGRSEPQLRRFQFSLRGLMVVVFGVAVGLSMANLKRLGWEDGVLAAASTWIVLGLVNQVRDLWRTFHPRTDLTSDERWGWRFAIFWRVGVACLLLGYYAVTMLSGHEVILLAEIEDGCDWVGSSLRHALFYLALVITLSSVLPMPRSRRRRPWSPWLALVGGIAVALLCLLVWVYQTLVHLLVAVAIQGIEAAQRPRFLPEGVDADMTARTQLFFWQCCFAAGLALVNLGLTLALARRWTRGLKQRLVSTGLLASTLVISASWLIWIFARGLPLAFPIFIEAQQMGPLHRWLSALLLVFVLVTAATYRLVGSAGEPGGFPELSWRRAESRYYHERRLLILLVAAAMLVSLVPYFFQYGGGGSLDWRWYLGGAICYGPFQLSALVLVVAVQAAFIRWRRLAGSQPAGPPKLPAARFGAVWLAMLLTALIGIPAIAIFSFSVWFSPWYLVPWP